MRQSLSCCPACSSALTVRSYRCCSCSTEVHGDFTGCPFCRMEDELRYFCLVFLQCEGNMKDAERIMGISYPTIKNRLSQIRKVLGLPEEPGKPGGGAETEPVSGEAAKTSGGERLDLLKALERGEVSFEDALKRLKKG